MERTDARVLRLLLDAPLRTATVDQVAAEVTDNAGRALARLVRDGLVVKVAHGAYMAVGNGDGALWRPDIETQAAAVAMTRFPRAVLMGVTAARVHGAIPRAIGAAVVAVPKGEKRRPVRLEPEGTMILVDRDLDTLRTARTRGGAEVTTVEQTLVDLVRRPGIGGMEGEVGAAVRVLKQMADRAKLEEIIGRMPRAGRDVRGLLEGK